MKVENLFEALCLDMKVKISNEEIEKKYSEEQLKLMKKKLSFDELEMNQNLINKAVQVLKDEKKRIEHIFEILCDENEDLAREKNLIENELSQDFCFIEYFLEINEEIEKIFQGCIGDGDLNQLKKIDEIQEKILFEKNKLLEKLTENLEIKKNSEAFGVFLKMKYFYRALEIIKDRKKSLNINL